jgi:hypothetical protein
VQVPRNTPKEDRWVDAELLDLPSAPFDPNADPDNPQSWEQRWTRVMNSGEYARKQIRGLLSECSAIAKKLVELKQPAPQAEALLWVRLSRLFSDEDETWRVAQIVGLIPRNGCQSLKAATPADILKGRAPVVRDKNNICFWSTTQYSIIDHAVIPLLEAR